MTNAVLRPEPIARSAKALAARCGTRDPFAIAAQLGIEVLHVGSLKRLKGMYRVIKGVRFIILNENNTPQIDRIVCAHELGHDQLHRPLARAQTLQEFMLYDMATRPEYEANLFAANLLLDDETVLSHIEQGFDIVQIAAAMGSDINLVALKIDSLIREGYSLCAQPHDSAFLR